MTTPVSPQADWAYAWGAGADGSKSGVWVGPKGTALPTISAASDLDTAPVAPFVNLGWLSDSGITEGHSMDSSPTHAFQGGALIKTVKSNETRTFQFQCLEENLAVLGLKRPGSTTDTTTTPGLAQTDVMSGTGSDIRTWVIDLRQNGLHKWFGVDLGEVTSDGDVVYQSSALTVYEFTVSVYANSDGRFFRELDTAPGITG